MMPLTLLPRLEQGSSGTSGGDANRVIWKPCFARVCDTLLFWEMAAVSLLHASAVGCAITEPLWSMACKSLHVFQQLVLFPSLVILQCSEFHVDSFEDFSWSWSEPLSDGQIFVGAHPDICGSTSRSTLIEMICCACAWWRASTQLASGLVQAGQWFCRRWYTWYDGQPGINRKTCRGSSGLRKLEMWVSFTIAVYALLLDVPELVHSMFCKRHRMFEKLSVLSLVEAGEWMFRDCKNPLYGSFEASFLIVQAYLMSAMITLEFVVLVNDVLLVPFFVTFTVAKCALVLVFLVLVRGHGCKHHLFLGELFNRALGDVGECVSRVFKDQVYGAFKKFFPYLAVWFLDCGYRVRDVESVNARKWMFEFEKFKLGCLDFCCFNSCSVRENVWSSFWPPLYCAVVTGTVEGLGMQSMTTDLGLSARVRVWTDYNAFEKRTWKDQTY